MSSFEGRSRIWQTFQSCVILYIWACLKTPLRPRPGGVDATTVLAQSQLTTCTRRSHAASPNPTIANSSVECAQKLIVSIAVSNTGVGTSQIEARVATAQTPNGTMQLADPFVVVFTNYPGRARYPLVYLGSANNEPYELSVRVNHQTLPIFQPFQPTCRDDFSDSATCGRARDYTQNPIPGSQGRCCSCTFGDQLQGVNGPSSVRGSLSCSLGGTGQASAHCLRFEPLWYKVYEIEAPAIPPRIRAHIYTPTASNVSSPPNPNSDCSAAPHVPNYVCSESLELTDRRQARSSDGNVLLTAVGRFDLTQQVTDFSNKRLLIPEVRLLTAAQIQAHPQLSHGGGQGDWLIVNAEQVALDGTQCDKIGVWYSAFRDQSNMCNRPIGSCLHNQVKDLWNADAPARARNQSRLSLSRYGTPVARTTITNNSSIGLEYMVNQIQDTLVAMEITADNIRFIRNVATGRIFRADATSFEALSQGGTLSVDIVSTGSLAAIFSVTFDCSENIHNVLPAESAVDARGHWLVTRRLLTQNENTADNTCTVRLFDAVGVLQDTTSVSFRTNSTCICLGVCGCRCQVAAVNQSLNVELCVSDEGDDPEDVGGTGGGLFGWFADLFGVGGLSTPARIGALIGMIILLVLLCFGLKFARQCCKARSSRRETLHYHSGTTRRRDPEIQIVEVGRALGHHYTSSSAFHESLPAVTYEPTTIRRHPSNSETRLNRPQHQDPPSSRSVNLRRHSADLLELSI